MGFGDKLKDLKQQAQEKVSENREKIQGAVDAASVAANEKTHGKYATKILKVNEKAGSALNNFSGADADASSTDANTAATAEPAEPASGAEPVSEGASRE
jgi:hypothetical protein